MRTRFHFDAYFAQIELRYTNNTTHCKIFVWNCGDGRNKTEALGTMSGSAVCSIKDQFSKKTGRAIAIGRAIKKMPEYIKKSFLQSLNRKRI